MIKQSYSQFDLYCVFVAYLKQTLNLIPQHAMAQWVK